MPPTPQVADSDFEARIHGYLRDGPERAPDHLLGAATVRIHATAQRRRSGSFRTFRPGSLAIAAALSLVLAVAAIRFGTVPDIGADPSNVPTAALLEMGSPHAPTERQRIATPTTVRGVVTINGAPWAVLVDGLVFQIDPTTGQVVREVDAQLDEPTGIAAGGGSVWVGSRDGVLVRVDAATGSAADIAVGIAHHAVAATDASVWVAGPAAAARVDIGTLEVIPFALPAGVLELAAVGDAVWATYASGVVVVADGRTGATRRILQLPTDPPNGPGGLIASDAGTVWLSDPSGGIVLAGAAAGVPAVTHAVRFAGFLPSSLAVDADGVWALFSEDGRLVQIDRQTLQVRDVIDVGIGARGVGLMLGGVAVWGGGGIRVLDANTGG